MGVGEKPKGYDLADYVLGHFSKEDRKILDDNMKNTILAVEMMLGDDTDGAMNRFNTKVSR